MKVGNCNRLSVKLAKVKKNDLDANTYVKVARVQVRTLRSERRAVKKIVQFEMPTAEFCSIFYVVALGEFSKVFVNIYAVIVWICAHM